MARRSHCGPLCCLCLQGFTAEEEVEEEEDGSPTEGEGDPCPNCGATYQ